MNVSMILVLRRGLESNHNHLRQCLKERPTPLGEGVFVCQASIRKPAIRQKVVQSQQEEVEAPNPVC